MLWGGVAPKAASSCPYGKHRGGFNLAPARQMRDVSLRNKCREWLNRKKQQTLWHLQLPTPMFLFKGIQEKRISIRHKRERKETDICGFEMEIKSLLVFILVPLSSSLPLTLFWLLVFYSPISGWEYMAEWMVWFPAMPQHRKRDLSCSSWLHLQAVFKSVHLHWCSNTGWTWRLDFLWFVETLMTYRNTDYSLITANQCALSSKCGQGWH